MSEKFNEHYREMSDLPPEQRGNIFWLTVDDITTMLCISRTTLWGWVKNETFPYPFKWRGKIFWPKEEVESFIKDRVDNKPVEQKKYNAITWDEVKALVESKSYGLITNAQIAEELEADTLDVTHLTRLMAKAGVLDMVRLDGVNSVNFYRIPIKGK